MNLEQAKSEHAQMTSNAKHAFRRATRMELVGNLDAADANWKAGIYWTAQADRENLQTALRRSV